jgi:hypothetical protein
VVGRKGRIRDMEIAKVSSENLKGRDYLRDLGIEGKIILKFILKK